MYKKNKIILIAPAYNEELKIGKVVGRTPSGIVDKILVIDDGSTDKTAKVAKEAGAEVLSLREMRGVGYAIREGYNIAVREAYDIAVVIAGNNKDSPEEIERLLSPIVAGRADFVIGSRFLEGGSYGGDMPAYRKIFTKVHPFLISLFTKKKITESTNGFRAIRVKVLEDIRINLNQRWLDQYELEVYLLMKILMLGFRHEEVPASKIYPPKKIGNTKMRPVIDWWHILKPIFFIGLGVKK